MGDFEITRDEIAAAAVRITGRVRRTPVVELEQLPGLPRLTLKLDLLQPTGSFKPRGAFNLLLSSDIPRDGVVAASGGNFGLAVAYAARELGVGAAIFVPDTSPRAKIAGLERLGAGVHVIPGYYSAALEASRRWSADRDVLTCHAYDQREVVAGQGTCGLEIGEQVADADAVLVAVGGGGLIGGVASWIRDDARLVAVESTGTATLHSARAAGGPVDVDVGGIAASSLGAARIGRHAWAANRWIDESVLVDDDSIRVAQRWLWDTVRLVVEPGAATPIAALLSGAWMPPEASHVVAVVCGANIDPGEIA
ncbi:MAG TPA: threonine/serine dehydratase [Acidimicrobiia bacterium]|nr:threonine/serine dehydratase [Acidimicrobiia bacterium]